MIDRPFPDYLLNARVLFGLVQQGHIPLIEKMLKEGVSWDEIGKEIGWQPASAKEHYGWYLEAKSKRGVE